MDLPKLIMGDKAIDDRGCLSFVNNFDFPGVKRFYQVNNHSSKTIRAFHGHLKENKFVYVSKGSVMFVLIPMTETDSSTNSPTMYKYVLTDHKPSILYIPAGYANGYKFLTEESTIIFFSTLSLAESEKTDDHRYPYDRWGKSLWEVLNR